MTDELVKEQIDRRQAERVDADVFISYKRSDRPKIAALAEALRRVGIERVWYDASLRTGDRFDDVIEANAHACRAMIVCWTGACFADEDTGYVRWEAGIGHRRGVLAPIALEPPAGIPFQDEREPELIQWNRYQIEDLSHWLTEPRFDSEEDALSRVGAHGPLSDATFMRLLDRLGEPALLDRPGLAELSPVYEAFDAVGDPAFDKSLPALETAVKRGRDWLSDHQNDPAAIDLARDLVDFEYAALGARVTQAYGQLLGDWTPPGAAAMARERGKDRLIRKLERDIEGKLAHIDQLRTSLERLGDAGRDRPGLFGRRDAPSEARVREARETARRLDQEAARSDISRPGAAWRDVIERLAPDALPEMVTLPPGTFLMGAPEGEDGATSDEFPQHKVKIGHTLAMGRYALTFAEWDAARAAGAKLEKPSDAVWGRDRRPVINVSWEDAQAYLEWLNTELGLAGRMDAYRLPSEAEWEYACRAGTATPFSFGETISKQQAQFSEGEWGSAKQTVPVGSFPPNAFGLHDMHGNVYEWCADPWHDNYEGAPTDGSVWDGGNTSLRVLRGGSWYYDPL